jgi:hypothetical protein
MKEWRKKSTWNRLRGCLLKRNKTMCKMKKSLYGLKQAPIQWYMNFESDMGRNATIGVAQTIVCLFCWN